MPKVVDHEQMRADLVEQSSALFAQQGFAALTMRGIAQALSVSTGTLYHYFPNKEALFEAVVDRAMAADTAGTEALMALPVDERLPLLLAYVDAHQERFLQRWILMTEALRKDDSGEVRQRLAAASAQYAMGVSLLLGLEAPTGGERFLALVNGMLLRSQVGTQVSFVDEEPTFRRLLST